MKNLKSQCPISYRVELDSNCQWYNQLIKSQKNPLPFECRDESPILARAWAFKIVLGDPTQDQILKPSDFNVFFVDRTMGNEFLISNDADPTIDLLNNLATEYQLYEKYGYKLNGYGLINDDNGKEYKVIDKAMMIEDYSKFNKSKVAVS